MSGVYAQLNSALSGMIGSVLRSVVQVRDGSRGAGAGTIWHRDGLIITNAHVAANRVLQVALPDGRVLDATVIARDEARDLAALSIGARDLPTIPLGSARTLQAGQWVMALGHPWGVTNAATGGVLIGVGSNLPDIDLARRDWVVADLHLRPGNSGGPMIDVNGRLIGVNTLMTGPGVGVAVSVDTAKDFLRETLGATTTDSVIDSAGYV
ncbi:MAG: trypsin-like peptidase domain-containing protein [Chloroflexota bacterium]|nr:trypsin-like peptidase domain-containing protein [Chloroflexota bacterium]